MPHRMHTVGDMMPLERLMEITSTLIELADGDAWDVQTGSVILAILSQGFEFGIAADAGEAEALMSMVDQLSVVLRSKLPVGTTEQLSSSSMGLVTGTSTPDNILR
eukprot:scaffold392082_cov35-Prasinocladus_malaysianus.AAC.1